MYISYILKKHIRSPQFYNKNYILDKCISSVYICTRKSNIFLFTFSPENYSTRQYISDKNIFILVLVWYRDSKKKRSKNLTVRSLAYSCAFPVHWLFHYHYSFFLWLFIHKVYKIIVIHVWGSTCWIISSEVTFTIKC